MSEVDLGRADVRRALRGLLVLGMFAVFWMCAVGLGVLYAPWNRRRHATREAAEQAMRQAVSRSFRWFLRCLARLSLFEVRALGELPTNPALLVANHPTLLDVVAIVAQTPAVCCVVKPGLVRNVLLRGLFEGLGYESSGDGSLADGVATIDRLRARLRAGESVLVFPEGTRSPAGGLHTFRRGAFEAARTLALPVVPLYLRCAPPALTKGASVFAYPIDCPVLSITVGEPYHAEGARRGLPALLEARYRAWLEHAVL